MATLGSSAVNRVLKRLHSEPHEYNRNMIGRYLPGSFHSILLPLCSWGSLLGVPIRTLYVSKRSEQLSADAVKVLEALASLAVSGLGFRL